MLLHIKPEGLRVYHASTEHIGRKLMFCYICLCVCTCIGNNCAHVMNPENAAGG